MTAPNDNMIRVEIAGTVHELQPADIDRLDVVRAEDNAWHMLDNGVGHIISVLHFDPVTRTAVFRIDGENREARLITGLDMLIEQMGLNKSLARKVSSLDAPMPGLVKGILVKPGDEVAKGAPLLILEAMKMENVMTAPDGVRIKRVDVQLGQPVEKGARLIEFDVD